VQSFQVPTSFNRYLQLSSFLTGNTTPVTNTGLLEKCSVYDV